MATCSSSPLHSSLHLVLWVGVLGSRLFVGGVEAGEIGLGSRLRAGANEAWISENGTFAFGFVMDSREKDRYLLAIWFEQLPGDRTIVWSPNRNSLIGKDAILELDGTGNLLLTDGTASVWTSNSSGIGVTGASMLDSGNLVLYNSTGLPVWQSFAHPSDTLVTDQPLTVSMELTSSVSRPTGGYYTLKMLQQPTSLSLALTFNLPRDSGGVGGADSFSNYSYWAGPDISNATGDVTAVLGQDGSLGIVYGESSAGAVYVYKNINDEGSGSKQNGSVLRRLTLETNGNLRLYRWDDDVNGSRQWVPEWAAVSNPCDIAGVCGNGICLLDKSKTNASCKCLPGTSKDDSSGLCLEDSSSVGSCDSGAGNHSTDNFKMSMVQQTSYYFHEDSVIANYSDVGTVSKCGEVCRQDCECVASVYGLDEETAYCWVLKGLDFGGFDDPSSTLFVKSNGSGSSGGLGSTGRKVLVAPIVTIMVVLIGLLGALLYYNVHKRRSLRKAMESSLMFLSGAPMNFSYRDLQIRTSNFAHLLGTGGFGSVYKGTLVDGTLVAVKKLDRVLPHGEKEFITEVNTIGSMHHMNLVRLCGYCSEGSQRLLVYEFMKNGSLDKWIFPTAKSTDRLLDWGTRFRIAIETAQGIAYFHEQCRNRIIHCDIKPENILLDENFCPKVSDFGLAKLMGREHSHVMTMVRGTRGYLAPEWVSNRPITVKADVYSYGMLLLEIIGGRRNLDMSFDAEDFFYPGWAYKEMMDGSAAKVADRRMEGAVKEDELIRALKTAFWCIQDEVFMRPTMGEIVKMLEGTMEINRPPMPQTVLELVEEGLDQVYRAMKGDLNQLSSFTITSHLTTSNATCSYSTMSPR